MTALSLATASDDERQIIFALGHLVFQWNQAEGALGRLLISMFRLEGLEDLLSAQIVTAELGPLGLANALNSFAKDIVQGEMGDRIEHAVKYYGRLREYRNFYVHGISGVLSLAEGPSGTISTVSAKGALKAHTALIKTTEIETVTFHAEALRAFVTALADHRYSEESPPPSLPDKPPLPDPLAKPHQLLRAWFAQREPFEA